MKLIAEHWEQLGMLAFIALGSFVLLVRSVRGFIEERREAKPSLPLGTHANYVIDNGSVIFKGYAQPIDKRGGPSVP